MIRLFTLLASLLLFSCEKNLPDNTSPKSPGDYDFMCELVRRDDADNILKITTKERSSDTPLTFSLLIGPDGLIARASSSLDSPYFLLQTEEDGTEYRIYYRDVLRRKDSLEGQTLSIEEFKYPQ
jgi:hypothetical protein